MNGIGIMLKSMGLDPEKIETAIEMVTSQISTAVKELERQGKQLDRIAAALNIGDAKQLNEENENGSINEFVRNGQSIGNAAQSRFIE